MKRKHLAAAVVASGLLAAWAAPQCVAQSPARRPVISPYLQLLRPQQGPLPNYQNFVVPRLEMDVLRTQQFEYEQQFEQQLVRQRADLQEFVAEQARPTGGAGAATFMYHSHYFPRGTGSPIVRRRF